MKPQKVLKVSYSSRNNWGYAIWNAIGDAEKRNNNYRLPKEFRNELGSIMLAISYRLDFLPLIRKRIHQERGLLYDYVANRKRAKDRYAFHIPENIKHGIIIDVDSFIFELRSCCELIEKLLKKILRHFKKYNEKRFMKELTAKKWFGSKWYKELKELRIAIFHHTAPYIDIDITDELNYDLLFCKENIHDYDKSSNFFRLSQIFKIYDAFGKNIFPVQKYIVNKINELR